MDSALHLTEPNIWQKFHENPSRGKGDMSIHKIKLANLVPSIVTLTGVGMAELQGLHIISLRQKFDQSLMKILWSAYKTQGLTCDLDLKSAWLN